MAPIAIVEHQLPGRVRLRVPSKRGDPEWFRSVIEHLAGDPKVDEASANPETGSILIRHKGPVDQIEPLAPERGILDLRRIAPRAAPAPRRDEASAIDIPWLDAAAIGLTGLGVYQLGRGQALGMAVEHFWSAFGAFRTIGSPALTVGFAGLGLYQLMRGQVLGSAASLFFYALIARHLAHENRASGKAAPADAAEVV
jgi:hypothetical protein